MPQQTQRRRGAPLSRSVLTALRVGSERSCHLLEVLTTTGGVTLRLVKCKFQTLPRPPPPFCLYLYICILSLKVSLSQQNEAQALQQVISLGYLLRQLSTVTLPRVAGGGGQWGVPRKGEGHSDRVKGLM